MELERYIFRTNILNADYIMRDHKVHGVRILPGVAFLGLIYDFLVGKGFNASDIELRNILFIEPISTTEKFNRCVEFVFEPTGAYWQVTIRSQKTMDGVAIHDEWYENMRCEIQLVEQIVKSLDVQSVRSTADQPRDVEVVYQYARNVDITHASFMKPVGTIFSEEGGLFVELSLDSLAKQYTASLYLHPAFLDCATLLCSLVHSIDGADHKPFIPIHIESFRATAKLGEQCFVRIPHNKSAMPTDDIMYNDIEVYDADGSLVVLFEKLSAKRVRSKGVMLDLESENQDLSVRPPSATDPAKNTANSGLSTSTDRELRETIVRDLCAMVAQLQHQDAGSVSRSSGFYEIGLDSTNLLDFVSRLERYLGVQLYPTLLFEFTTVDLLATYLIDNYAAQYRAVADLAVVSNETPAETAAPAESIPIARYLKPHWVEKSLIPQPGKRAKRDTLIFCSELAEAQGCQSSHRTYVCHGAVFRPLSERVIEIDIHQESHYELLFDWLRNNQRIPSTIYHLISHNGFSPQCENVDSDIGTSLHSLTFLCKALSKLQPQSPVHLVYGYTCIQHNANPLYSAMAGFVKSVDKESRNISGKCIGFDNLVTDRIDRIDREVEWSGTSDCFVRFQKNHRYVHSLTPVPETTSVLADAEASLIRPRQVVLITGGAGKIGMSIAEYLVKKYKSKIVLIGRSSISDEVDSFVRGLKALGSESVYYQADVTDSAAMSLVLEKISSRYGELNGVIHLAGNSRDALVENKTIEEMTDVLSTKIKGTLILDAVTSEQKLDYFLMCSSSTALLGNIGQSDYAYANRFMDEYVGVREQAKQRRRCSGKTLSINWPLWESGGMRVDDVLLERMKHQSGMHPLPTNEALDALEYAFREQTDHLLVLFGDTGRVEQLLESEGLMSTEGLSSPPSLESAKPAVTTDRPASLKIQDVNGNATGAADIDPPAHVDSVADSSAFLEKNSTSHGLVRSVASTDEREKIAIIGVEGRYPMADNVEVFWDNLKAGKDCITEIPADRWDFRKYKDATDKQRGVWGGFIDDVDKFDPLFFGISPAEAERMDPQERLFLETAWKTVENAGYPIASLSGKSVGVFVGVMWGEYQLFGAEELLRGNDVGANSMSSSIANRVSYMFNLTGPSFSVNSACSSSLLSIHLAVQSILQGECEMAIAGGCNLSLHPSKYQLLNKNGFLSSDGRCRSFGEGGDGYVPSEGIGAVILKPLSLARRDRDTIYAVINSSSVNHGGKTSGYAVPNPQAHANLIDMAMEKGNINPRHISYVEAHGTGTSLGDPIEIAGLMKAYGSQTTDKGYCAIGSVKSNIGHLESAAGISGITKILLQLKHQQLVPSLHASTLNSRIKFDESAFYVQQQLSHWEQPIIEDNGASRVLPRLAAISSFGAGGLNVHMLLEEEEAETNSSQDDIPCLVVLSAATEPVLHNLAQNLSEFIKKTELDDPVSLRDVAYTLQTGRDALPLRIALVAESKNELIAKLDTFIAGVAPERGFFITTLDEQHKPVNINVSGADDQELSGTELSLNDLERLGRLWVLGRQIDWASLYTDTNPHRIPLPGYAFSRERYWVRQSEQLDSASALGLASDYSSLHPLIESNISTLREQRYRQKFNLDEYYVRDHRVRGKAVVPGGVLAEMARVAGELAEPGDRVATISQLTWMSPLVVEDASMECSIQLQPRSSFIEFTINSVQDGIDIHHARGRLQYASMHSDSLKSTESSSIRLESLDEIRARCTVKMDIDEFYKKYSELGFDYGSTFQSVETIYSNGSEVLASLRVHDELQMGAADYGLHPVLLDGALQAIEGFSVTGQTKADTTGLMPFSIDEIQLEERIAENCYAHARNLSITDTSKRCDIDILGQAGELKVRILGFCLRTVDDISSKEMVKPVPVRQYFTPVWHPHSLRKSPVNANKLGNVLVFVQHEELANQLESYLQGLPNESGGTINFVFRGSDCVEFKPGKFRIDAADLTQYEQLFAILSKRQQLPDTILHLWKLDTVTGVQSMGECQVNEATAHVENTLYTAFNLIKAMLAYGPNQVRNVVYAYAQSQDLLQVFSDSVAGLARTVQKEHANTRFTTCQFQNPYNDIGLLVSNLVDEMQFSTASSGNEIAFQDAQRCKRSLVSMPATSISDSAQQVVGAIPINYRHKGTYLISGGMGGLGLAVACNLSEKHQASLILLGRSEISPDIELELKRIRELGGNAEYIETDISDLESMQQIMVDLARRSIVLNGVFHSAGVVTDARIVNKEKTEFEKVVLPKIFGTLVLDHVTSELPLDFFAFFSSIASTGNEGQCDYASGNSFMDSFAFHRMRQRAIGKRSGQSISINWPLWKSGGMSLNTENEKLYTQLTGMTPISTEEGLDALKDTLSLSVESKCAQILVAYACSPFSTKTLGFDLGEEEQADESIPSSVIETDVKDAVHELLTVLLMEMLKLKRSQIAVHTAFSSYGFDSITIAEFASKLNDKLKIGVSPAALFEHTSLGELSEHLLDTYQPQITTWLTTEDRKEFGPTLEPNKKPCATKSSQRFLHQSLESSVTASPQDTNQIPIAIVGVSGAFPQSKNIDEFWQHLENEDDLIEEIPSNRWDWRKYEGDPREGDKSVSKWGGFLSDVRSFDAAFFGIPDTEAELMDPQQRLALEHAWNVLEDAGYSAGGLAGSQTSVFLGIQFTDYITRLSGKIDSRVVTGNARTLLANRISNYLDFHGPSQTIDTGCSSSLVAIHRAVGSLRRGESTAALVGGVNVMLSPEMFLMHSKMGMLSPRGACRTFDKHADGYVRGEGVGIVMLKTLADAESDNDHIYGVIRGSSENHCGHTNSLTAPNANAQAQLITNAINDAGLTPADISYVEMHGTGTPLGDPVEIRGLKKAFASTQDLQHSSTAGRCGLGSVKTNVGHLEPAAGIAGVIKVLLGMKYQKIPANIHFSEINPYIDLADSPFYIVKKTEEWKPTHGVGGERLPRRAGVSSFGFGGVNAHLILEEHDAKTAQMGTPIGPADELILLSATTQGRLHERVQALTQFLTTHPTASLQDIAFTLQVGRVHMKHRLAMYIQSTTELKDAMHEYLQLPVDGTRFAQGSSLSDESNSPFDPTLKSEDIARLWAQGHNYDWNDIRQNDKRMRISLPTYPFESTHHWVSSADEVSTVSSINKSQLFATRRMNSNSNLIKQDT